MALKQNTWTLNQWYDQDVAGNVSYSGSAEFWYWGLNSYGQAGQSDQAHRSSPVQVPGTTWNFVGFCRAGIGAIKTDGTLWTWGKNNAGQLGLSNTTNYSSPKQVGSGTDWNGVSIGDDASIASKTDGTLWTFGINTYGAHGTNNTTTTDSPVQVPGTGWARVSSSVMSASVVACKTDGTLWSWGYNNSGGLGLNDRTQRSSPTQIPGTTWPTDGYRKITQMQSDGFMVIKQDGTLWAWGNNDDGVFGINQPTGTKYSSPVQVGSDSTWSKIDSSNNNRYSMGIKTDGTLWCIGGVNTYGNAGVNDRTRRSSPIQVGSGTDWYDVACDNNFCTAATKTDGTLWTWGRNDQGQLGQNQPVNSHRSSPVQIPGTDWNGAAIDGGEEGFAALKNI